VFEQRTVESKTTSFEVIKSDGFLDGRTLLASIGSTKKARILRRKIKYLQFVKNIYFLAWSLLDEVHFIGPTKQDLRWFDR
jgi:hypothetical protein